MIEPIKTGTLPPKIKACIALTSWKKRINTVGQTIYNLFTMCGPEFHIVLTLAVEEFPMKEQELPRDLLLMNRAGVFEILWVKKNWKSLKKWIFCGMKYSDVPIISADDDCIYTCNYANQLLSMYQRTHCPIITYNKSRGWCKTQGPCTLYNPPRIPFIPLALSKYVNDAQDDSVISDVINQLGIATTYYTDTLEYPFVFHTTEAALNPEQYSEAAYKPCLVGLNRK